MDLGWNTLAALGSVSSIIGFIISVVTSKETLKRKMIWFSLLIVMAGSIAGTVYLNSELKRIKDIHNKAESVYEDYSRFGSSLEYVHEVLTFLEENKDSYPDAYERANRIYDEMKEDMKDFGKVLVDSKAAEEMNGIIKGIVTLNKQ